MPIMARRSQSAADAAELQILRRVAEQSREAFKEMFAMYYPRLFKFLFRLTRSHGAAEELSNDVMLTLWTDAGRFRGDSKVSTWVFGIAYRKALAHLRKRKLNLVQYEDQEHSGGEVTTSLEREDWVRQGIYALPPKQRITVMLVYYLGLSCEETAAATGVPASTVKTRMFHARRKLKGHLDKSKTPEAWPEDDDDDTR